MLISIEKILWLITSIILLSLGIFFSIKLRFPQLNIKKIISVVKENNLSTLNLTLAAKIGVGSLAGVALAIYLGGIGTIFWMWISSIICASNTYVESYLAVINRKKDKNGSYYGGPSTYISKNLSKIYSILVVLAYTCGFLTIQVNTISKVITDKININPIYIGIIISIITCPIIFGGIKKINKICNKLVPIMTAIYMIVVSMIILTNIGQTLLIIKNIIIDALNPRSLIGLLTTFTIGIQRGIFSNESGIGTSAISASTTCLSPKKEGYMQILGVYIATLVICTSTAIVILLSDYTRLNIIDPNGIEITKYAFFYHLGNFGNIILILTIILFAISTIITGYYYGESNLKLLTKDNKKSILLLKLTTLTLLVLGSILTSTTLWKIVDIFVAFMAIINVYSILKLSNHVKK